MMHPDQGITIDSENFRAGDLLLLTGLSDPRRDGVYEVVFRGPDPFVQPHPSVRPRSVLTTLALQGWRSAP